MIGPVFGFRLVAAPTVGDPVEDWSRVRSPGRAARRRRQGHAQNITTRYVANGKILHDKRTNTIYAHPDDAEKVRRMMEES